MVAGLRLAHSTLEMDGIDMVVKFALGYEDTPTVKRYKLKKR